MFEVFPSHAMSLEIVASGDAALRLAHRNPLPSLLYGMESNF
jgi:hypothetical protein